MTEEASQRAEPTAEAVIAAYMDLRHRRQRIKAEYEKVDKKLADRQSVMEMWLQSQMSALKTNALPTDAGTAHKVTVEQATVVDMDALLEFIKKNEAWHLLDKRVSKAGVKAYLDENLPVPPGVNWYTNTVVRVRKPSER